MPRVPTQFDPERVFGEGQERYRSCCRSGNPGTITEQRPIARRESMFATHRHRFALSTYGPFRAGVRDAGEEDCDERD